MLTQVAWSQVEKVIPSPFSPPRLYNDFTQGGQFLTGAQASSIEKMLTAFDD
ncbi:MAG: TPM domain-containing protein, partial [Chitinophagaceae bacterium]|nr:TPM domain-containing protein [Chitinophagaceae bacterium]